MKVCLRRFGYEPEKMKVDKIIHNSKASAFGGVEK
jgi:hypothetical protein